MLEIKNIQMSYGPQIILNDISYKFDVSKIYGLIGKNGAGKTTLLKIIMRLIRGNQGTVLMNSEDVNNIDFTLIPASFISDTALYYNDLTVYEHLLLICRVQNIKKNQALEKIKSILECLKLDKYKNNYPLVLSRGTLQRLNIAIGLLKNSGIYLLDEPFITLDPVQVSLVENLLIDIKKNGKLLLVSSHDIDSLSNICDKYLILKNGKLLEFLPENLSRENITELIGDSYGD